MVRTTIACARCRKHKVKCDHDGTPPCRGCLKKGRVADGQCVLSLPILPPRRLRKAASSLPDRQAALREDAAFTGDIPSSPVSSHRTADKGTGFRCSNADASTVLRVFCRKFPELRFVHEPTLLAAAGLLEAEPAASHQNLLFTALEALCLPLIEPSERISTSRASSESRMQHVRDNIPLADPPTVHLVQTLLVLSMYEWATGHGHRAWSYCGLAIRMMQLLKIVAPRKKLSGVEAQVYNRTGWSCFVMDRLVFCGKPQSFMLSVTDLCTHWPVSEEDFTFGGGAIPVRAASDEDGLLAGMGTDMNHYYDILVRGFDIWARILKWIVSGGRRLPGMSSPDNHPWEHGSPWRQLYDELQAWRARQDRRLHYVQGSPKLHASLGQGEAFGYINLIYYVSLIFLNREYIPFLPSPEMEPRGPVDAPLLPIPAPGTWWHDRAAELFSAAANIPLLLTELQDADAAMATPFIGFCAFSAATMNLYVSAYPNMNLKRNADTSFDVLITNLNLLNQFRGVWAMGEGWWETIQHCKRLYELADRDRASFRRTTRNDYLNLENSIHDSSGKPPDDDPSEGSETGGRDDGEERELVDATASMLGLESLADVFGQDSIDPSIFSEPDGGLDCVSNWQNWPLHYLDRL